MKSSTQTAARELIIDETVLHIHTVHITLRSSQIISLRELVWSDVDVLKSVYLEDILYERLLGNTGRNL